MPTNYTKSVRPKTTRQLSDYKSEQNLTKYPGMPPSAVPKGSFSDSNANELTKCIIYDIENVLEGLALRINNTGIYDPRTKRFRKSHTRKGIPDIIAVIDGKFLGIEVKYGSDRQSPEQKEIEKDIISAGGIYFVAKTYSGYVENISTYFR